VVRRSRLRTLAGETAAVPTWTEAYERLVSEGKLSRVNHPSADHTARHFSHPRLKPPLTLQLRPHPSD
jgi:hypothetical protein